VKFFEDMFKKKKKNFKKEDEFEVEVEKAENQIELAHQK